MTDFSTARTKDGKAVLIIAYHWPPDASVGGIRPVRLAKELSQHGWRPIVLTVKERYHKHLDRAAMNESRETLVLRASCLPSLPAIYLACKACVSFFLPKERRDSASEFEEKATPASRESVMAAAKRVLLSLVYTPDGCLGWLPSAFVQGFVAIKAYDVKCMVSTGPPFSAHVIGLTLHKFCGVPWVADFRDPWSWNEQKPWHVKSAVAERIDKWLEKKVIDNAERVICVTPAMTERYRKMYATSAEDKWLTITNGFDPEEFNQLGKVECSKKFTISYIGGLDYGRSPEALLRAIEELVREGVFQKENLAIKFIGHCRYANGCAVEQMIADHRLSSIAGVIDPMPRGDALREMLKSHVLVLLAHNQRFEVPAKAYEYLATRRPILALSEEGATATADFIKHTRSGVVVLQTDVAGIKEALAGWYEGYKAQGGVCWKWRPEDSTNKYAWTVLGAEYVSVLDACHARKPHESSRDGKA